MKEQCPVSIGTKAAGSELNQMKQQCPVSIGTKAAGSELNRMKQQCPQVHDLRNYGWKPRFVKLLPHSFS
jgi:hypothetical protein